MRLGYHRSFPLRCRGRNLHLYLPNPRDRWKPFNYQSLFDRVSLFTSRFKPPAPNREEEKSDKKSDKSAGTFSKQTRNNFEHLLEKYFDGHQSTENETFVQNANSRRSANSKNEKVPPRNAIFVQNANSRRSANSKNEKAKPLKKHPPSKNTKYNRLFIENQHLNELRLNKRQQNSIDDVFGTSRYFTFIAQDELPSELLVLAAKIRAAYLASGKVVKPQRKECLLPVIWDSGASVCVSFDSNDFVGPIQSVPAATRLRGFFRHGPRIRGLGYVAWSFLDDTGQLRTLKLPGYICSRS
jgi:hypothetical protein